MPIKNRPDWLTIQAPSETELEQMKLLLEGRSLHTVCESADCPNIGECFSHRTCTFMILGDICTRNCSFCAVQHGRPLPMDLGEPAALADLVYDLGMKHVVITSVTRDDLPDGGANHFANCIKEVRARIPNVTVEVLIPDFQGNHRSLMTVIEAEPDIINHNIETVPRLYGCVRPQAVYSRSLELLDRVVRESHIATKSGLMLGLGETWGEVLQVMNDLRGVSCKILTLGQYLQPSVDHFPVVDYIHPYVFARLKLEGYKRGFRQIEAGPMVRSSYHAALTLAKVNLKGGNANG